ncbi:epidermal growth factor receptor substrate 15-like 1 isoform X2 [Neocloeon triangulifer]|uniref:epidermal growth factor receptor substrate 15-like 1 isoform X2 n=1 Tax=Neocloeon triangulifer TaxID=2078957 RepID=UPI00286EF024|nr:epidermal growth factor receptor substrate 15-like 1 isoform X2 [Neocloeon triangulifer]
MAALPSPTQVAGGHAAIYEAYYQQVDPSGSGSVPAQVAAKFLKKSGLSDIILSRIWDLSDTAGRGFLNKQGFFVALKLVSLAQAGKALTNANMLSETPPPKVGELPNVLPTGGPPKPAPGMGGTNWTVQPAEKIKYDKLFDSLEPINGLIPGAKVKNVMMNSKLPLPILGKIWDLADADKDGMLDRHEFTVAMHLVYKGLENHAIPATLPPDLQKPSRPPIPVAPGAAPNRPAVPPMPNAPPNLVPAPIQAAPKPTPTFTSPHTVHWVVGPGDRAKYEPRFKLADKDQDGFVSGAEIKDIFLQSGVPPQLLAHIWGLCDTNQLGKLNLEQFMLAMWLIEQKLKGVNPPPALAPDMVPPSMRPKPPPQPNVIEVVSANAGTPYQSTPELDMISKEIAELAMEKRNLETDIAQKEADIKIKSGEIKSLQGELDTLAATLKQLENQKGEAQKRLNDLKGQVAMLRCQADEQERTLKDQEDELNQRKQELENLKTEETRLETSLKSSKTQFEGLNNNLQETQLLISQAKAKITQLEEQQRQMDDAITMYDTALTNNDAFAVPDTSLEPISTEFREPEFVQFAMVNGVTSPSETKVSDDPFASTNGEGGFQSKDNAFGNDEFTSDPFAANFDSQQNTGFDSDPFASLGGNTGGQNDPFDPFGEKAAASKTPEPGADAFGCDPFANSTSPALTPSPVPPVTPQPGREDSSPTPALPPKKSKQPPPRPAPPKAMLRAAPAPAAPTSPSPEPNADPFGQDAFSNNDAFSSSAGGFANFADFDKFSTKSNNNNGISRHSHSNNNNYTSSSNSSSTAPSPAPPTPARPKGRYAGLEFTEDPFRDYRYEDPFEIEDPFASLPPAPTSTAAPSAASNNNVPDAWGLSADEERKRKLREQEKADYEYALALSQAEGAGR